MGLDPMVNIITGLPGENMEDAKETLSFIQKLNINSYSHNYLRIYSGTELGNDYKKWGYKIKHDKFLLPYNIIYPYDVNKLMPLNNSVSRSEIVRLKKLLLQLMKEDEKSYHFSTLSNNEINDLKKINLNDEIFIWLDGLWQANKCADMIVNNKIPTNNINYIVNCKNYIKCFNCFDRQNYIKIYKVKNSQFKMPNNYYELLFVETMNGDIQKRFEELNVNPYVNRFVICKNEQYQNAKDYLTETVKDYCKAYNKEDNYEVIIRFLKLINYDIENITFEMFKRLVYEKKLSTLDGFKVMDFLKYYLLGVVK
jgi:hypothetical protein